MSRQFIWAGLPCAGTASARGSHAGAGGGGGRTYPSTKLTLKASDTAKPTPTSLLLKSLQCSNPSPRYPPHPSFSAPTQHPFSGAWLLSLNPLLVPWGRAGCPQRPCPKPCSYREVCGPSKATPPASFLTEDGMAPPPSNHGREGGDGKLQALNRSRKVAGPIHGGGLSPICPPSHVLGAKSRRVANPEETSSPG